MRKPRGCFSVGVLERYVSLPVAASTLNAPIELLVRSAAYRNLPSGVTCRSEAQMSFEVSRGACPRSEEHTSELQSRLHLVCRLLLEKKKNKPNNELSSTTSVTKDSSER